VGSIVYFFADSKHMPYSDRLGTFSRNQHLQQGSRVMNASCDSQEWFRHERVFLRQCLKTLTHVLELIEFAQNRLKRHEYTALSLKNLRWENFRWTGLGQKT